MRSKDAVTILRVLKLFPNTLHLLSISSVLLKNLLDHLYSPVTSAAYCITFKTLLLLLDTKENTLRERLSLCEQLVSFIPNLRRLLPFDFLLQTRFFDQLRLNRRIIYVASFCIWCLHCD